MIQRGLSLVPFFVVAGALLVATVASAAVYRVPLTEIREGNKYITVLVNGEKVDFLFDTGCSNILLSRDVVNRMLADGTLRKSDMMSESDAEMADGTTHKVVTFPVGSLQVGGCVFRDFICHVGVNDRSDATPLLGQNVLSRMKWFRVCDNMLEFEPLPEEWQSAVAFADRYWRDTLYSRQVAERLAPLYRSGSLSFRYKWLYGMSLYGSGAYQEAVSCFVALREVCAANQLPELEKMIADTRVALAEDELNKILLAGDSVFNAGEYTAALKLYEEVLSRASEMLRSQPGNQHIPYFIANACYDIFFCHVRTDEGGREALDAGRRYITSVADIEKRSLSQLADHRMRFEDERMGQALYIMSVLCERLNDTDRALKYRKMARNAGYVP